MASTGCAVSLLIAAGPGGAAGGGVRQDAQQVTGVDQVTEQHAEQPPVQVYALTRLLCYGALRPGYPP